MTDSNHYSKVGRIFFKILRGIILFLLKLFYGFRAYNPEVLKAEGPVLLMANHVSWIDWLLIGVLLDEDWKFVTSSVTANLSPLHRFIMINRRTFPIDPLSPYSAKRISEYLKRGGRLVLFPEGRMSRTGNLMKLYEGAGFLLQTAKPKIILCWIRGAERTVWAKHKGWKKLFSKITLHFEGVYSLPDIKEQSSAKIRERLTIWLYEKFVGLNFRVEMEFGASDIPDAIMQMARQRPSFLVFEDAQMNKLTYRKYLVGIQLLRKALSSMISRDDDIVGIIMPNVVATTVLIPALWRDEKIPAVLNYSSGAETMLKSAEICGIKTIITSKTFIEKIRLDIGKFTSRGLSIIYLEDIRQKISGADKTFAFIKSLFVLPELKNTKESLRNKTAVILFTSGSEGAPKGVELTHQNILANIRQLLSVVDIRDDDRLFACLPFFHSFGLTIGMFVPLVRGLYSFIYPSPLHYRLVPVVFYEKDCTIMFSTNTFLNGYLRRAHPYDFHNMRLLFAGAEKVQPSTAKDFSDKFGVRILEGYGVTECSPVLSVNTPMMNKPETAGRFLPGVEWRLEPVEGITGKNKGRLFVKGPNIMKGYINPEENSRFKALGGWYDTGDIVSVDEDGFVKIIGRVKRFAKVSGEMIALGAVEDILMSAFRDVRKNFQIAVISIPSKQKGEEIIAVTNSNQITIADVRKALLEKGFSPLAVPRNLIYMAEIPKLGSGKIDYPKLKSMLENKISTENME